MNKSESAFRGLVTGTGLFSLSKMVIAMLAAVGLSSRDDPSIPVILSLAIISLGVGYATYNLDLNFTREDKVRRKAKEHMSHARKALSARTKHVPSSIFAPRENKPTDEKLPSPTIEPKSPQGQTPKKKVIRKN